MIFLYRPVIQHYDIQSTGSLPLCQFNIDLTDIQVNLLIQSSANYQIRSLQVKAVWIPKTQ